MVLHDLLWVTGSVVPNVSFGHYTHVWAKPSYSVLSETGHDSAQEVSEEHYGRGKCFRIPGIAESDISGGRGAQRAPRLVIRIRRGGARSTRLGPLFHLVLTVHIERHSGERFGMCDGPIWGRMQPGSPTVGWWP